MAMHCRRSCAAGCSARCRLAANGSNRARTHGRRSRSCATAMRAPDPAQSSRRRRSRRRSLRRLSVRRRLSHRRLSHQQPAHRRLSHWLSLRRRSLHRRLSHRRLSRWCSPPMPSSRHRWLATRRSAAGPPTTARNRWQETQLVTYTRSRRARPPPAVSVFSPLPPPLGRRRGHRLPLPGSPVWSSRLRQSLSPRPSLARRSHQRRPASNQPRDQQRAPRQRRDARCSTTSRRDRRSQPDPGQPPRPRNVPAIGANPDEAAPVPPAMMPSCARADGRGTAGRRSPHWRCSPAWKRSSSACWFTAVGPRRTPRLWSMQVRQRRLCGSKDGPRTPRRCG